MKILILSRYDRQGASSRLRTMQYIPYLQAAGMEVDVSPLFDAAYLADMYRDLRRPSKVAGYYFKRLAQLRGGARTDVVWLEKEALPWLPWFMEKLALPKGVPIVSDYDDAIFHRYDQHGRSVVKHLLGHKIDEVMAHSTVVTAGNAYLAKHARSVGARHVELVPTVVDTDAYRSKSYADKVETPRIGWIGTPETWSKFGRPIFELVRAIAKDNGGMFRAVGAGHLEGDPAEVEFLDWSEQDEIALIQGMDIGIMPLQDTPWARGKCGYKLIQYMACGLPVVASPVGVNKEIVEHGVNGYLASNDEEWKAALETLLRDQDLRQRMGHAGRKKVEAEFSLQTYGPRVAHILQDAAGRTPRLSA